MHRLSLDSDVGNRPRWLKAKPKGQVTKGQATTRDKALTRAEAKESKHRRARLSGWMCEKLEEHKSSETRGRKPRQAKSEENLMEEQHPSK